jgi:hypothetical protein
MFVHTVYFWLQPAAPASAADQLAQDCRELLGKIPTVRHLWAGKPAMTPRDVVDNSYAVGLTVILDDDAGHDVYQTHELHLLFIARNKPHWSRVQVYDFR